ncbi:MAG: hypothetical protein OEZ06_07855 [Myxococcales bacterium]|nr:hypothetical protein [Myxococcales bacterium]
MADAERTAAEVLERMRRRDEPFGVTGHVWLARGVASGWSAQELPALP